MTNLGKPSVHRLPIGSLTYELDRRLAPVLTISPGDTVVIDTEDAFSGQIRHRGDKRDKRVMPYSNPARGPILIDGAEPGDGLRIRIEAIDPLRGQCATYIPNLPYITSMLGNAVPDSARICSIQDGVIEWSDELRLPFRPMIGVVATAPAEGTPTTGVAGDYGGNLDIVDATVGSVIVLPVYLQGGLLFVGDCHALQGQGEVTAAGLEMAARLTLQIDLHKNAGIPGPRIESPSELAAVATARSLEQAIGIAFGRLALWIEQDFNIDRWEAYSLLAQVGELSVGYFAGGIAAAKVSRKYVSATARESA